MKNNGKISHEYRTNFLKALDEKVLFPLRFNYLEKLLTPYLKGYNKVLDIGAGCGRLSRGLQEKTGIEFIGVDKHLQEETYIPISSYDGKHLPFADNSFDCSMLIDVLHHDRNPSDIISEARRVSKKDILIKDHYWKTELDFAMLSVGDYIGNMPYGVDLPYNFLNMDEWAKLFEENGLRVKEEKKFRFNPIDPLKHVIFNLEK